MASPPREQPATTGAPAAASSQLPAASHPLPRAFLATSPPRATAAAPAPPLLTGRPLNPNPPGLGSSLPHGILYPVLKSASTSNSAAAATVATAQLRRVPPMAVGYPRTHAVAVPIPQQQQQQPRSFAAVPRALVAGVAARPEQPPRGVPIASQPKVNPVPPVAPSNEQSNPKGREKSREEPTVVVINGRKVRSKSGVPRKARTAYNFGMDGIFSKEVEKVNLLDSESGSLYALCRSWVRNGVPHESQLMLHSLIQPSFGNGEPLLPRPLPASVVDSRISEMDNNDATGEDSDEEPQKNANGEYNTSDLLKQHVKRAKRIRARVQKDRLRRIERYKQRLALLLKNRPVNV